MSGDVPTLGPACTQCPACRAPHAPNPVEPITDRYGLAWDLARCRACGVCYQVRPMTAEARKDFYGSGRYRQLVHQATGESLDRLTLMQQQGKYAARWLPYLTLPEPRSANLILDYGGSTGAVVHGFIRGNTKQYHAVVADYGDGATVTPEQALDVVPKTYGLILCCQTLDHLADPLAVLHRFREVSKGHASLFIDVVKAKHCTLKIDHDTYYPTLESFTSLLTRGGWEPQWVRGDIDPRHWAAWCRRMR